MGPGAVCEEVAPSNRQDGEVDARLSGHYGACMIARTKLLAAALGIAFLGAAAGCEPGADNVDR